MLVSARHQPQAYICHLSLEPSFHFLILFLPFGITQNTPFCPSSHSFIQFMLNASSRPAFELYAGGKERSHCISYTLRHLDHCSINILSRRICGYLLRPCIFRSVYEYYFPSKTTMCVTGFVSPENLEGNLCCFLAFKMTEMSCVRVCSSVCVQLFVTS